MISDIEQVFNEFWKPILAKESGEIDIAQLKKELFDYHMILGEVPKVYDSVTNGQVSKPNTAADVVIAMNDDVMTKSYNDGYNDCLEDNAVSSRS